MAQTKTIKELKETWEANKEGFKAHELGKLQDFVRDIFESKQLFDLKYGDIKTPIQKRKNEFTREQTKEGSGRGRADMVLFIDGEEIVIPVEVEKYGSIKSGESQILQYQTDWRKKYGILTDGSEWRLYFDRWYEKYELDSIFDKKSIFWEKWEQYITHETYYDMVFDPKGQLLPFSDKLNPCTAENRPFFFNDITTLLNTFKTKISALFPLIAHEERQAVETTYSYVIQFILYKVLIDNNFQKLKNDYETFREWVKKAIQTKNYNIIIKDIKNIAEYIYKNIYEPFRQKQEKINKMLIDQLKKTPTLDEIAPWLDIIMFIDRYNFADIRYELFGFVYENYLKELYHDENKGQYFTDPAVVNFMLHELGYTKEVLSKTDGKNISIIDPSCGAGTFLYSATLVIKEAFDKGTMDSSKKIEDLVNNNIFGLDIAEFPLFLAEMNILMQLLPVVVGSNYSNVINDKLKLFETKDSISEFLDTPINDNTQNVISSIKGLFDDFDSNNTPKYMRDSKDLMNMFKSLEGDLGNRQRFDYVIGNPPYIGYLESNKQNIKFTKMIKGKSPLISMSNVYGVNLNSVPGHKKSYAPMPNLYSFFVALGLALLKNNGKICYIIPQTILTAGDLDVLRYHLAKYTTIEKIITFYNPLFIGRGIKQKTKVATSSLIFIIRKLNPIKNHNVNIVNYNKFTDEFDDLDKYFVSKNKVTKKISQNDLLEKMENWNFIKHDDDQLKFCDEYIANTISIEEYRLSQLSNYDEVQFDRGLKYDKKKIDKGNNDYALIKRRKEFFSMGLIGNYLDKKYLVLPKGAQGLELFNNKYKILWSYMNFDKFYFSSNKIMIDYNWIFISSNNKEEMLYLLALLNSNISLKIFDLYLRSENEQAILIGIKSIKKYIRVPILNKKTNKDLKNEIIKYTGILLDGEVPVINDVVDFPSSPMQKFDFIRVTGNNLILTAGDRNITAKIGRGKSEIVKTTIEKEYFVNTLISKRDIDINELKFLPVIDFKAQNILKDYINDLVFALYMNINIDELGINNASKINKIVSKNEFHSFINSSL